MRLATTLLILAISCSTERTAENAGKAHDAATPILRSTPDSSLVRVRGPTLIAFYPDATQAQVDSSEELTTVLDDFSYHLSSASDSLAAQGFTIVERSGRSFPIVEGQTASTSAAAGESACGGYGLRDPGRGHHI